MFAPDSRTSHIRIFLSKSKPARVLALIFAVAVAAMALGSTSSSAGTFGQVLLAKAAAMIGVKATAGTHALESENAAEPESSSLATERRGHTATRLQDGRVLVAGGENSTGALNGTEIFDPVAGTFSAAGNMNSARADHTATLLADGRVLIAGGRNSDGALATTEIFDPSTGTFAGGTSLSVARAGHSATRFADGRIFIAGGDATGSAEIIDSALGGSAAAGNMNAVRSMHSSALLQDGRVLLVGGKDAEGNTLKSVEVFDATASSYTNAPGELAVGRVLPHLRVLFDGKVQIIGGNSDVSLEIYQPSNGEIGAYVHLLPDTDTCTGLRTGVRDSQSRAALFFSEASETVYNRTGHSITELPGSNQALVVGGQNNAGSALNSSSIFASSPASITTDKIDYAPGETVGFSGRGWQPGETVRVVIHEDPHTHLERNFEVVADESGNIAGSYQVEDHDLFVRFVVG
ncbi:MAG TPA: kelch repeat-containing protein, partial [Pyrinomonadaceae bacterium]|nr:kelch repeat-containing protein [Pyrinomonadaceae bacterium]